MQEPFPKIQIFWLVPVEVPQTLLPPFFFFSLKRLLYLINEHYPFFQASTLFCIYFVFLCTSPVVLVFNSACVEQISPAFPLYSAWFLCIASHNPLSIFPLPHPLCLNSLLTRDPRMTNVQLAPVASRQHLATGQLDEKVTWVLLERETAPPFVAFSSMTCSLTGLFFLKKIKNKNTHRILTSRDSRYLFTTFAN